MILFLHAVFGSKNAMLMRKYVERWENEMHTFVWLMHYVFKSTHMSQAFSARFFDSDLNTKRLIFETIKTSECPEAHIRKEKKLYKTNQHSIVIHLRSNINMQCINGLIQI